VPRLKQITRDLEIATMTRNIEKISSGIEALNLESNQILKILVKELMAIA
jgi:transcription initiation factor IIF auxiliary subunit